MNNKRISEWKIFITRANSIIEVEKVTAGVLLNIYEALREEGKNPSILNKYELLTHYVFKNAGRIKSESPIIKFEIEAGD